MIQASADRRRTSFVFCSTHATGAAHGADAMAEERTGAGRSHAYTRARARACLRTASPELILSEPALARRSIDVACSHNDRAGTRHHSSVS